MWMWRKIIFSFRIKSGILMINFLAKQTHPKSISEQVYFP